MVNVETGEEREILAYPQLQLGAAPRDLKYRFQWNAPIRLSPHDPGRSLSRRPDRASLQGRRPELGGAQPRPDDRTIPRPRTTPAAPSPTTAPASRSTTRSSRSRNRPTRQGCSGPEATTARCTSPETTVPTGPTSHPRTCPSGGTVNVIDLSAHDPGRAFIAVYRYREDDFNPYIFRTNDYGESWDLADQRNERHPGDQLHTRDSRRSRSQGTALRRHGVRSLHLLRRRRPLADASSTTCP